MRPKDVITQILQSLYSLIYTLGAKEQMQELAENFDSQGSVHNGSINLGLVINASLHGAELVAADAGVFDAIDDLVHTMGQVIRHGFGPLFKKILKIWRTQSKITLEFICKVLCILNKSP